jgi:hypothetical protein
MTPARLKSRGVIWIICAVLCVIALLPVASVAQNTTTSTSARTTTSTAANTDFKILLDKIKADKKLLVASNMELTETEKATFWPIYDAYQKDLGGINERLAKGIKAYADAYNARSITNEQAKKLTDEMLAIEADEAKLRSTYAAKLGAALPARTVARYLQIESKIRAALRYDMASSIPLVP